MAPNTVLSSKFAEYSVGWICTTQAGFVAARAMLDDEHGRPASRGDADRNSYFLGSISGHNIVIACLPAGASGAAPAATVAASMQRTFRDVRVGLLVGVGSGAPTDEHDIRLGDVVVGIPTADAGGVVQFELEPANAGDPDGTGESSSASSSGGYDSCGSSDIGSQSQSGGGRFVRSRCLNAPPPVLLTTLINLGAEHALNGNKAGENLAQAAQKYPRAKLQFAPPVARSGSGKRGGGDGSDDEGREKSDKLFEADYVHVGKGGSSGGGRGGGGTSSAICGMCDVNMLVQRPHRDFDGPVVHYGLIASGNSEIACGVVRRCAQEALQAICFEREAAGLMNNFPCLVIRGICDYADSHKNIRWQGYAAATAAAFAKELLEYLPQREVQEMARIVNMIERVEQKVSDLRDDYNAVRKDQYYQNFLSWLSTTDYGSQQADLISMRQEGTCEWFLQSPEFVALVEGPTRTLLCPGIPGSGKTYLSAIVVNNLRERYWSRDDVGIAVVYCSYSRNEEQTKEKLLAGLLRQLVHPKHSEMERVQAVYELCEQVGRQATFSELSGLLHDVAGTYSMAYIVIDALDECDDAVWSALIAELRHLQSHLPILRLIVTFRPHVTVGVNSTNATTYEVRASAVDLKHYVEGNMSRLSKHVEETAGLQREVIHGIVTAADGMFLLAKLHLDSLVGKRTVGDIRSAVKDLPKGLNQLGKAYDQTLVRIKSQDPDSVSLARRLISWVTHARRPLSPEELQAALAVRVGDTELDDENLVRIDEAIALCAGLLTFDLKSNIIRLIHFTADEYFKHNGAQWIADAPESMTLSCLTYLSLQSCLTGRIWQRREYETLLARYPLVSYAARHWAHHISEARGQVLRMAVVLLGNVERVRALSYVRWHGRSWDFQAPARFLNRLLGSIQGIHLAAEFGLHGVCQQLIANGSPADPSDCDGQTPLSLAAKRGHKDIVQMLVGRRDVRLYSSDDDGRTPLSWAAVCGHEEVAKLLLGCSGVAADFGDGYGRTPLAWAAANGHVGVAKLLLDRDDVDADSRHKYGRTPLSWAAASGSEELVQLLLERDEVAADSRDEDGRTPLCWAADSGRDGVVKLLLSRDDVRANSEEKDKDGRTLLSRVAERGHELVVRLLIGQEHTTVDSVDETGRTPLSWAAQSGHAEVVKLLVGREDVASDSMDSYGRTPLSWAAGGHRPSTVKRFVDRNFVASSNAESGLSPFSWAAKYGHEDVVQQLLHPNYRTQNSVGYNGRTQHSRAAEYGYKVTERLLLGREVGDLDSRGQHSPIHFSRVGIRGNAKVARLLLGRKDVTINSRDVFGRTPLSWAAENANEEVVMLLLGREDIAADSRDINGCTPLSMAAIEGQVEVARLLLGRKDVRMNSTNKNGRTPLALAAQNGREEVVKVLLGQENIAADSADVDGMTPLSMAAWGGHVGIVKLLLGRKDVAANSRDKFGRTPLFQATIKGQYLVVEVLLGREDVSADIQDIRYQTPLSFAVEARQKAIVKLLLGRDDAGANFTNEHHRAPLSVAAGNGSVEIVELLLGRADVATNTKDQTGRTPLSWASMFGHGDVVKLLLRREDVAVNPVDHKGQTPLSLAAEFGCGEVVQQLLNRNDVAVHSKDKRGRTPLFLAACYGRVVEMRMILGRRDTVTADSRHENWQSILFWAAKYGCEAEVKLLLGRGDIDANSEDKDGRSLLSQAAEYGYEYLVKLFCSQADANINSKDKNGRTPLSWASEYGREKVVRLLLSIAGIAADLRDVTGWTPLFWAARRGHRMVVRQLLDHGVVAANSNDEEGRTPLSWAAKRGHDEVVKQLLSRDGINVNLEDTKGRSTLSLAAEGGHDKVVKLLLARDDVAADSKDKSGWTPLSWASRRGRKTVVKQLLGREDVAASSRDWQGRAPLFWAAKFGHEEVVMLLLGHGDVAADIKDARGRSPLSIAAEGGHDEVVKLLLAHDGCARRPRDGVKRLLSRDDVAGTTMDLNGWTPLSLAAGYGHGHIMEMLLDKESNDATRKRRNGRTLLWWLAAYGDEALVKRLIHVAGADIIHVADEDGQTPLSRAAEYGNAAFVGLLFDLGSDPGKDATDTVDRTPLLLAARNGHAAVVQLLLSHKDHGHHSQSTSRRTARSCLGNELHDEVRFLLEQAALDIGADDDRQGQAPTREAINSHPAVGLGNDDGPRCH